MKNSRGLLLASAILNTPSLPLTLSLKETIKFDYIDYNTFPAVPNNIIPISYPPTTESEYIEALKAKAQAKRARKATLKLFLKQL